MYPTLRRLLFKLDAERTHHLAVNAAKVGQKAGNWILRARFQYQNPMLEQSYWGRPYLNPVGIAAGFDKNAEVIQFWEAVGCGFMEVGSVSARPAPGNTRPRAFRLPDDEALINRMGLNNEGADAVARRVKRTLPLIYMPLGINLAKTHDPAILGDAALDDFAYSFRKLAPLAGYIALNISCPNTEEGKTFEDPDALSALLDRMGSEKEALNLSTPILIKLSPPATATIEPGGLLDDLLDIAMHWPVSGFIISNTASDRAGLRTPASTLDAIGRGGLSGKPVAARSTALIRYVYQYTHGQCPIIGVGGIDSAESAYEKIRAGAGLLQLYTGLVYKGPGLIKSINSGLVDLLQRDGFAKLPDAIGRDV